MRRIDVFAVLLLIGFAINSFLPGEKGAEPYFNKHERTPPIVHSTDPSAPPSSQVPEPDLEHDPKVFVKPDTERTDSSGTAFSIDDDGFWLTARHVARDCDRLFLIVDHKRRKGIRVRDVFLHPNADVALLRTNSAPPALRLSDTPLTYGELGFGLGYPKGDPGDIAGRLMGRASLKIIGRREAKSPLLVWSEEIRRPERDGSLGGLSGGPMLDVNGDIVGVVVAEARRRGRVMTADLLSVAELIDDAISAPDFKTAFDLEVRRGIGESDFDTHGKHLRKNLTIAKAVCLVD